MNTNKQLTKGNTMKKLFMILGIIAALNNTSQASEWKVISNDLNGYNFYTNKFIKGANF
tara:strand:+ start:122 stop:298 length:177 start_codon:yes stop_codon:yes gene_type:complete